MKRFVKIKLNNKIIPHWLWYIDKNYKWSEDEIKIENAKSIELAKMAFLDHGELLIPLDNIDIINQQTALYTQPITNDETVFLVYEGGNYMTLCLGRMEIIEEINSKYYPINNPETTAIVCENDPFDKNRGGFDNLFLGMAKVGGAKSFHYIFNFRNRSEEEIIEAFKNTPAILFYSSHKDVDWWELMIRCIIKSGTKAKVIGKKPSNSFGSEHLKRFELCVEMAKKYDVCVIEL